MKKIIILSICTLLLMGCNRNSCLVEYQPKGKNPEKTRKQYQKYIKKKYGYRPYKDINKKRFTLKFF